MSAPHAGRQSPDPERQTGAQLNDTPGTGRTTMGSHPSSEQTQKGADEFKSHGLTSNPEHPLEKIEAAKFAKGKHD
ncbi:hypothetical protein N7508_000443 [Penicillium antarcticum]|uniref:uncharacterized protein n=1 Tax=Penicillium antarcticum TaxID=416450 RepID=UPI00239E1727|nr:uncharacterized protein N7508_000443 [Penicillium antarcticum]KAJ5320160.1 hypothetical protein N7508_000443 [Penicillium antarcticum]